MNRKETTKILSVLKAAYPNSYKDLTDGDINSTITLWETMFADKPYEVVAAALKSLIATSKWTPTIAEINEKINALSGPSFPDEVEAWGMVTKALANGIYESQKEFDCLPDIVKQAVGSHNMIREWAMMDISEVQTVIQSHFLRSYRARADKAKEFNMLPSSVQVMLTQVSGCMKPLPEGSETV